MNKPSCEEIYKEYLIFREKTTLHAQTVGPGGSYTVQYIVPEDMERRDALKKELLANCEIYIDSLDPAAKWDFYNVS